MTVRHTHRHHHGIIYYNTQPIYAALALATTLSTVASAVAAFCTAYGYQLQYKMTDGASPTASTLTYTAISDADALRVRDLVKQMVDEYSRYPVQFFASLDLQTVWIAKTLAVGASNAAGVTAGSDHAIYFCLLGNAMQNTGRGSGQDAYRNVFNHELSHIIDITYTSDQQSQRSAWEAANPTGWAYNGTAQPGFMTGYASTNYGEDRAEVNAWNMTPHLYWSLQQRKRSDAALGTKSNLLIAGITSKTASWQQTANKSASGDYV